MFENLRVKKPLMSYNLAMESIDFQTDSFGSQIEAILYDMEKFIQKSSGTIEQLRQRLADSELVTLLDETIFKRFGLKVSTRVYTSVVGGIVVMSFTTNHIFHDPEWRGKFTIQEQQKLIDRAHNAVGTIDLENAKVGGIFSEYEHRLFIDIVGNLLVRKISVPEIAAFILHEIGHAFTYYEFADRLESTNQILVNLSREIKGKNDDGKRHYILKELANKFGVKEQEFDDILNEKNNVIFGIKLFNKYIQFVKSQMPNRFYDRTASEQVADNFAARFGYGRQLITGLDKFEVYGPNKNSSVAFWMSVNEFIFDIMAPSLLSIFILCGGFITLGVLVFTVLLFFIEAHGEKNFDHGYDAVKIRYKRIRQQSIEMIKQMDLSKEELRGVVDNVHFMDGIIQNTAIYRTLYNRIANFIFLPHKAAKRDQELQSLMEELATNDLFLKSAELEVLA